MHIYQNGGRPLLNILEENMYDIVWYVRYFSNQTSYLTITFYEINKASIWYQCGYDKTNFLPSYISFKHVIDKKKRFSRTIWHNETKQSEKYSSVNIL